MAEKKERKGRNGGGREKSPLYGGIIRGFSERCNTVDY